MKGLFWSVIRPQNVDSTMWKSIDDKDTVIDEKLLVEHFAAKKSKAKKEKKEGESKVAKPKEVKIVDGKKQQNAGIVIKRLKMTSEQLKNAVKNMDESLLTPDKVEMLTKIAPTGEETGKPVGNRRTPPVLVVPVLLFVCLHFNHSSLCVVCAFFVCCLASSSRPIARVRRRSGFAR